MKVVLIILFCVWLSLAIVSLVIDRVREKRHKELYQEHMKLLAMKVNVLSAQNTKLRREMEKLKNDSRLS